MLKAISILAASALVTFFATTDPSFAASKKQKSTSDQAESCLGGGCLGESQNPNRTRPDYYSSYYKRSSKKKKTSDQ